MRDLRRLDRTPGTEALRADLSDLVREAGLRRAPTFVVSRSARVSGNTFGAFPVRYVRLDLGLVHAHRVAPGVFRAVVLHELAHLRNADVTLTRLTIALAWAFPLAVLVPVAVNYAGAVPATHLLGDAWRLAAFALVVQVSAWSVLRAREFAADARLTGADAATIRALLATKPVRDGRWSRLAAMFRFQPLARARADELDRPVRRVSARPVEALGAGLAAGIAAPPLTDLMSQLPRTLGGPDPLTGGAFLVGLLLGVPLALVTTGALWRSAWWARHGGGTAAGGGLFGAALAAGLLVGRRLAWSARYASDRPAWWVELAWAVLGIAGGVLLGRWVALGARAHLRRLPVTDAGRTRLAWAGAATATAVLIAAFVASILVLDAWSVDAEVSMLRVLAAREGHPEHVTVLTLVDTLGWYVRMLADHAPYLLALPLAAALHPVLADRHATRRALRLGIVAGAVGAAALPLVVVGIAVGARDPGLGPAALRSLVDGHTLLPVTLVEATVATVAVANRRLSMWHALLAAGAAGLLLLPVLVAVTAALPCLGTAAGPGCVRPTEQVLVVRAISHALLVAPVFATVAAALGAAVAALSAVGRARHRRWLISGAAVLTLLGASAAVHRNPGRAAATGQDGCLVGVWRLASGRYHLPVPADSPLGTMAGLRQDASVDLTSGPETGFASAYRTDGTATDLFDLAVAEGSLNGHTVRNVRRGIQTYRWTAEDGRYRQRDGVTAGDVNVVRVGARELDISSVMADSEGSYRCASDRLIIRLDADDGSWGEETFVRSSA
ncbi:M48 family metalloprotease [Micromonospora sp. NPDC005087]|uniref:M48 family metalloprotease n=1 Tax=Micromonospora sp. NPDC005087 TaxID=3364225 RepID=UPI0036BF2214